MQFIMDDDIDDIYGDLPNFELDKECERLQKEVEDLKLRTDEFSCKIDELTKEKDKLIKQKSILLKNISILLKTARQEIQRKDEIILQLRNELDTLKSSKSFQKKPYFDIKPGPILSNVPRVNEIVLSNSGGNGDQVQNVTLSHKALEKPHKERIQDRLGPIINTDNKSNNFDSKSHRDTDKNSVERLNPDGSNHHRSRDRYDYKSNKSSREKLNSKIDVDRKSIERADSRSYRKRSREKNDSEYSDRRKSKERSNSQSCRGTDKSMERLAPVIDEKLKDRLEDQSRKGSDKRYPEKSEKINNFHRKSEDYLKLSKNVDNSYRESRRKSSDRYDSRSNSRFHRTDDRLSYDNDRRGQRKQFKDDKYDEFNRKNPSRFQKLSSRSPLRHSKSPFLRSRSRSPYPKRKRSNSRSPLDEKQATLMSETVSKDQNPDLPQPIKSDISKVSDVKDKVKQVDNEKIKLLVNATEKSLKVAAPSISDSGSSPHEDTGGKEDGEMTDSDVYEEPAEPHDEKWQTSQRKPPDEPSKTIFTIRMTQKLKREDEERKRAMIQAVANQESLVDATLFEKPKKVIRTDNRFQDNSIQNKNNPVTSEQKNISSDVKLCNSEEVPKVAIENQIAKSEDKTISPTLNAISIEPISNEPKLTLNIAKESLQNEVQSEIISNPMETNKKLLVETYSPFKDNYKLIELSPAIQLRSNFSAYHKNMEVNRKEMPLLDQHCERTFIKCAGDEGNILENITQPLSTESNQIEESNKESTVKGATQVNLLNKLHESLSPKFEIKKPLKPLSPTDILNCEVSSLSPKMTVPSPVKLNNTDRNQLISQENALKNETVDKKLTDLSHGTNISKRSLNSYRIPKKSSYTQSNEKGQKDDSNYVGGGLQDQKHFSEKETKIDVNERKRKLLSPKLDSKKSRLTALESFKKSSSVTEKSKPIFKETKEKVCDKTISTNTITKNEKTTDISKTSKLLGNSTQNKDVDCKEKKTIKEEKVKIGKPLTENKIERKKSKSTKNEKAGSYQKASSSDSKLPKVNKLVPFKEESIVSEKNKATKGSSGLEGKRDEHEKNITTKPKLGFEKAEEERINSKEEINEIENFKISEKIVKKDDNDKIEKSSSSIKETSSNDSKETIGMISIVPEDRTVVFENSFELATKPEENDVDRKLNSLNEEKFDYDNVQKKKEELMSGLNLDATPLNFTESSLCVETLKKSPNCPVTPDIPRELLNSEKLEKKCQKETDYNFSDKLSENKNGSNENCDIANFEIFKSVNLNNSSSSLDNSHESKGSNRLQNDLCLSESESESERSDSNSNSSDQQSDSEASDIMEMF